MSTNLATGHTLLRVKSHRASDKLSRLTAGCRLQWYWSWEDGNNICAVPNEYIAEATKIAGITRARPKHDLHKCWELDKPARV